MTKEYILSRPKQIDPIKGCWIFTGHKHKRGYGLVNIAAISRKKKVYLHRLVGVVYFGLDYNDLSIEVMHRCNNPSCFNPEHLKLGSHADNMAMTESKKITTHCRNGHEYTPENTWLDSRGAKICKICKHKCEKRHRDNKKIVLQA